MRTQAAFDFTLEKLRDLVTIRTVTIEASDDDGFGGSILKPKKFNQIVLMENIKSRKATFYVHDEAVLVLFVFVARVVPLY